MNFNIILKRMETIKTTRKEKRKKKNTFIWEGGVAEA